MTVPALTRVGRLGRLFIIGATCALSPPAYGGTPYLPDEDWLTCRDEAPRWRHGCQLASRTRELVMPLTPDAIDALAENGAASLFGADDAFTPRLTVEIAWTGSPRCAELGPPVPRLEVYLAGVSLGLVVIGNPATELAARGPDGSALTMSIAHTAEGGGMLRADLSLAVPADAISLALERERRPYPVTCQLRITQAVLHFDARRLTEVLQHTEAYQDLALRALRRTQLLWTARKEGAQAARCLVARVVTRIRRDEEAMVGRPLAWNELSAAASQQIAALMRAAVEERLLPTAMGEAEPDAWAGFLSAGDHVLDSICDPHPRGGPPSVDGAAEWPTLSPLSVGDDATAAERRMATEFSCELAAYQERAATLARLRALVAQATSEFR